MSPELPDPPDPAEAAILRTDTPETDAALVGHMPADAEEWSQRYLELSVHARKLERERNLSRIPICIGWPILDILVSKGMWTSKNGNSVVAADGLFRKPSGLGYSALERQRMERRLQRRDQRILAMQRRIAELESALGQATVVNHSIPGIVRYELRQALKSVRFDTPDLPKSFKPIESPPEAQFTEPYVRWQCTRCGELVPGDHIDTQRGDNGVACWCKRCDRKGVHARLRAWTPATGFLPDPNPNTPISKDPGT